jgi:2-oxoglutarate ferredoxin oxidoreductase subunit beta
VLDNGIYGLTKGQASPTTSVEFKLERHLAGTTERPLNPVLLVLSSGCGFVARTHAGNMPHMRQMFRAAIQYPGFAFVHVLAGCVTYQPRGYADGLLQRSYLLPEDRDPADLDAAMKLAREDRFPLGVLYRRPPVVHAAAAPEKVESDVWSPDDAVTLKQDLPSE